MPLSGTHAGYAAGGVNPERRPRAPPAGRDEVCWKFTVTRVTALHIGRAGDAGTKSAGRARHLLDGPGWPNSCTAVFSLRVGPVLVAAASLGPIVPGRQNDNPGGHPP